MQMEESGDRKVITEELCPIIISDENPGELIGSGVIVQIVAAKSGGRFGGTDISSSYFLTMLDPEHEDRLALHQYSPDLGAVVKNGLRLWLPADTIITPTSLIETAESYDDHNTHKLRKIAAGVTAAAIAGVAFVRVRRRFKTGEW